MHYTKQQTPTAGSQKKMLCLNLSNKWNSILNSPELPVSPGWIHRGKDTDKDTAGGGVWNGYLKLEQIYHLLFCYILKTHYFCHTTESNRIFRFAITLQIFVCIL